jgi:hypothetical protein
VRNHGTQRELNLMPVEPDTTRARLLYLTHALLKREAAGPFCQVGDEQAIALKRLSTIFGAAKLKRGKEKFTPQDEVEYNAPQRVQTTVSPPRVISKDPDQISLQKLYHHTQHLICIEGNIHLTDE